MIISQTTKLTPSSKSAVERGTNILFLLAGNFRSSGDSLEKRNAASHRSVQDGTRLIFFEDDVVEVVVCALLLFATIAVLLGGLLPLFVPPMGPILLPERVGAGRQRDAMVSLGFVAVLQQVGCSRLQWGIFR